MFDSDWWDNSRSLHDVEAEHTRRCSYCKRNDNWSCSRGTIWTDIGGIPHKITACEDCLNNPEIEKSFYALSGELPPE